MSLFHQVAESFRARQRKKAGDFLELVRQVTAEKGPDPAEVAEALDSFGQTLEAFEEAVRHQQQRNQWAAQAPGPRTPAPSRRDRKPRSRADAAEWEALTKGARREDCAFDYAAEGAGFRTEEIAKGRIQSSRNPTAAPLRPTWKS